MGEGGGEMKIDGYDIPILKGIKLYSNNEKVSGYPIFIGPHIFLLELPKKVLYGTDIEIRAFRVKPGSIRTPSEKEAMRENDN
jgi:hypothetical protein